MAALWNNAVSKFQLTGSDTAKLRY